MDISAAGRWLFLAGLLLSAVGLLLMFSGKIPFIGRLPGDIYIKRDHFTFYFPIVTCLAICVIISLLLKLFGKK